MKKSLLLFLILLGNSIAAFAQVNPTIRHLNNYSYFYGRQYYVLRSGRTQMFIQSDKVDLGSAFTYLLYDAEVARQSEKKDSASNYNPNSGFETSGLQLVMGGFPFTALGQNTTTRWVNQDGIPMAEAVWWAGGIQVTEKIFALAGMNAFERSITLKGLQIVAKENVSLRLGVPEGNIEHDDNAIIFSGKKGRIALTALVPDAQIKVDHNYLDISNITISPGERKTFETFIVTQIPSGSRTDFLSQIKTVRNRHNWFQKTKEKWHRFATVKTHDPIVEHLFNNVKYTLPGYVSNVGIMDAGVFEYGAQWIRDGSYTVMGLLQIGDFRLARALLKHMLDDMVAPNGETMASSQFARPMYQELDQMGELWEAMKNYYYWTGDSSLLKDNASKLIALTQRPIQPLYLNSTGMVHDRREYWERSFSDAYELIYQVFVIQGLRDAAELAPIIGAQKYARHWKEVANKMLKAMLTNPKYALVHNNHLIKRRNVDGQIVDTVRYKGYKPGSPALTENLQRLYPDASMALPIAMRIINPKSSLARNTLEQLQSLWDSRWSFGGYDRYNTSSQPDQPGPWPPATCMILNAQQEAGMYKLSRRTLKWLYHVQGGHTGAYFEEIPIIRSQESGAGLIPWTSAQIAMFVVKHWLGVRFSDGHVIIKPNLYPGTKGVVKANLRYRNSRIRLTIDGAGPIMEAIVNGSVIKPNKNGSIELPLSFSGGTVEIKTK